MVYKPAIPQSTDFISQSQKDIIGNFEDASDIWGKPPVGNANVGDHIPLTNVEDDHLGGHKKITMPEQSSAPTTLANEMGLYTKDTSGSTEVYYRRESNGTETQVTAGGGISIGGLVLRAYVVFDFQGNIVEVERLDAEGKKIKVPISFNVSSVTPNQPLVNNKNLVGDWDINFTQTLPTADYFWMYQSFNDSNPSIPGFPQLIQAEPFHSGTYSDAVSTTRFRAWSTYVPSSGSVSPVGPVFGRLDRMIFQAYTVA